MNDSAPRHPEAQTMTAFLEGTLPAKEIRSVADHLSECAECRVVVTETARFTEEEQLDRTAPRRRYARWLAVAAVLAIILIAAPILLERLVARRSPMEHLIAAAPREHRLVETRLSGFPWARLQVPVRGSAAADPDDLKLAGAAGDVLGRQTKSHDANALHATGVAYLLIGDRSRSLAALQQAADASDDAKTWNDLAAALFVSAEEDLQPQKLPGALAAADHALRLDPKNAEALFNRALIVERMGVVTEARKAWQRYLEVDPASGWSIEARSHLRQLAPPASLRFDPNGPVEQLVRDFPGDARAWGEAGALGEWAEAAIAGDESRAARVLARTRLLADALAAANGEHLLDDAVSTIERTTGEERLRLAEAHRLYAQADAVRKANPAQAESQFRRAAELFAHARSPMADAARHLAATAAFDQSRDVHDELAELAAHVDGRRHPDLLARVRWHLGLNENRAGDWGAGVRNADLAAAGFRALGERKNAAIADEIAAYALEMIGAPDEAWKRRVTALRIDCADGPVSCNAALGEIATTLAVTDRIDAALSIATLFANEGEGDPANLALSTVKRARVIARAGDGETARRLLAEARRAAARTPYPERLLPEALIAVEEAALLRNSNPAEAIRTLNAAQTFLDGRGVRYLLPYLHLQSARAFRAARNGDAAEREYDAALRAASEQQRAIDDPTLRLAFFDSAGEAAEEGIDLALSRGAVADAFATADRRHAFPGSATAIPRLGRSTALIEYAVLPRSLVIFCVTDGRVAEETVAIDRHALDARIETFTEAIRRRAPESDIRRDGAALFHILVAPLHPYLAAAHELVIVPDRQLHSVPFSALYDGRRFLVEDFVLSIAPAATTTAVSSVAALEPALIVADPRPEPASRALRAGREEAAEIAAMYGGTLLTGDDATPERFAVAAEHSALIHYTGHANSDAATSYGALLLAGRVLGTSEVARLSLKQHPCVVLAACGTFRGDPAHVAGMSSLARAFLIAGARAVAGTLWEIDDDVSANLFLRFHQGLHAGASPAAALRDAQLAMLHSADERLSHPAAWSPVEILKPAV